MNLSTTEIKEMIELAYDDAMSDNSSPERVFILENHVANLVELVREMLKQSRLLELSTAHVPTDDTGANLTRDFGTLKVLHHDAGVVVAIPAPSKNYFVPAWFVEILHYAINHNYRLVSFRYDAQPMKEFGTYSR